MLEKDREELTEIKQQIDEHTSKYVEDDFNLKLNHHKRIADILEKRDEIIKQLPPEELNLFYERVIENFDPLYGFFPTKADQKCDFSFMKSIKVEYLDDYKMKVSMELNENEYIENKKLEKTMYLFDVEPETTKILWKNGKGACPLFDFFENNEDDFETFDILYEFYIDMLFFAEVDSD